MRTLSVEMVADLPEFEGMTPITTQGELEEFTKGLRQDWYSPDKLARLELPAKLDVWVKSRRSNVCTLFAAHDEPDNHGNNDGWGNWILFRCLAILDVSGKIHFFKEKVEEFKH